MSSSLRAKVYRAMLAVILVTAVIRIMVWLVYQAYEARLGHVVFHEQIGELLLLLLVEVLALGLLAILLWHLSRMLLSPLRSVANAARLIAQGKLTKRIRTRHLPAGELQDIAHALNQSFDRYQEAIDRISRFSSAASHQLRTPLTAMQTTAESSLSSSTGDHREALESILEEIEHLRKLTEQLLLLSRMEVNHVREQFAEVDLNDIVNRIVDLYRPLLEEKDLRVDLRLAETCSLRGDETLLMEATMNLFDNAAKWSPHGGSIRIHTEQSEGVSTLNISDHGPGIDPTFRHDLFERFSRHAATAYKGSGLGLSIVSEAARLHGGTIELKDTPGGGATFKLTLPVSS